MTMQSLEDVRRAFKPNLPAVLTAKHHTVAETSRVVSVTTSIRSSFPSTSNMPFIRFEAGEGSDAVRPMRVGAVLSGGPAPGGHNVITGLYDSLKAFHPESRLYGFLNGPSGIVSNDHLLLDDETIARYRNQGGFDMLGSGRTKLETAEQFERVNATAKELELDGIVVIGGDDSNTNAAVMAEWFAANGSPLRVIGVPKTIDGDLKNEDIEVSFGFHTATRLYSELIGNVMKDARSGRKYWHFIRLMGRAASHVTLECALATHPNVVLISEEIFAKNQSLKDIVAYLADVVVARADKGKNYGVVVFPEGIVDNVPMLRSLIEELNDVTTGMDTASPALVTERLAPQSAETYTSLPDVVQEQLLLDRDSHGNIQISRIETEKLLIELLQRELEDRRDYKGSFDPMAHFFGYEGRAGLPSNFDCTYCYGLGVTASALVRGGHTGVMSALKGLHLPAEQWTPLGVPIVSMMHEEIRHGVPKPVIEKALVDLCGANFKRLEAERQAWEVEDKFVCAGPLQFEGATADYAPISVLIDSGCL
ncbi:Pyrophosphate-dependent phosphofructokinase PfpB [Carpediemonas membranifera]|uniref:Pyrophosphate--fructose 6-phosphate 1-phosphotransferase n=1 Tax=Carpediemonas membranifera TaxID=201153 RepID=A0A8J6AVI0_9EUKA|nr:Pyrophosphate-dependent phosphofructokinase PfpB [Carpediemonas membranifera]|eukprot:KAG9392625.1 Pyrophosphate-dependent phosphofructokinase PfpB [Carpediemonas membranifera]